MNRITTIVEALVVAGATPEMILAAVRVAEAQNIEAEEQRKAKGRDRWHRWDEKQRANVSQREPTLANNSRGGVTRVEDKTSKPKIEPQEENKKRERALASTSEFDDWYACYPHKVQRGAAERAFPKARSLASLAELKAGVAAYVASKPVDRPWQNPATWLNGKGWLDSPANVIPMARGSPVREIDQLLDFAIERTGHYDADATAEIEGYQASPRRLPAH